MDQNNELNLSQTDTENQTIDIETGQAQSSITTLNHETLGKVYAYLLRQLPLTTVHRDNLRKRGFTDEEIQGREYGSLQMWMRKEIAQRVVDYFGEDTCVQVPGFYKTDGEWNLAGGSGLIFPLRDAHGLIYALKVRGDLASGSGKYTYFSSKKKMGGKGPASGVHVPLFTGERTQEIRLTEGELKADAATVLGGILTISIPGVQTWRKAPEVLCALGIKVVRIAFDMDAFEKRDVARAVANSANRLLENGFEVVIETWDRNIKGIDDALLANIAIQKHQGQEAQEVLTEMLMSAEAATN